MKASMTNKNNSKVSIDELVKVINEIALATYGVTSVSVNNKTKGKEKGIVIRQTLDKCFNVDVHVNVASDVKIIEVLRSLKSELSYKINRDYKKCIKTINVYADNISL